MKKTLSFTNASKRKKYLRNKFNQGDENCKTIMKKSEKDTNKGKYSPCLWIRSIKIVKMSILPKAI